MLEGWASSPSDPGDGTGGEGPMGTFCLMVWLPFKAVAVGAMMELVPSVELVNVSKLGRRSILDGDEG